METATELHISPAKLRAARESAGLSLIQAAQAVGLKGRQAICNYEAGTRVPRGNTLARLCSAYSVPVDSLFEKS